MLCRALFFERKEYFPFMSREFFNAMMDNPIIAAVKDMDGLQRCCECEEIKVVFILFGDVCSIENIVKTVKETGKIAMVHVDLVGGLSSKEVAVDFIKSATRADGIISTKASMIKRAKELSMYTVLRCFLLDSMALDNIRNPQPNVKPDFLEVLPGVMPKIIKKICHTTKIPIIAGGLISDKEDVMSALNAGAIAVSTTNIDVWIM